MKNTYQTIYESYMAATKLICNHTYEENRTLHMLESLITADQQFLVDINQLNPDEVIKANICHGLVHMLYNKTGEKSFYEE